MKTFYIRLGMSILWLIISISNIFTHNYTTVAIYVVISIIFFVFAAKPIKIIKEKVR